jgi:hypothetical protein
MAFKKNLQRAGKKSKVDGQQFPGAVQPLLSLVLLLPRPTLLSFACLTFTG